MSTPAISPTFNVTATGSGGFEVPLPPPLNVKYGVLDVSNATNSSTSDYASITMVAAQIFPMWLQVKDNDNVYPAGTFAGFEIENVDLVNVGLFDDITITTYLNGTQKDSKSGGDLLLSGSLVNSSGKRIIGFTTSHVDGFNQVRITVSGVNLGVSQTRVYNAVFKKFCETTTPLACNTKTYLTSPNYPVVAEGLNSGVVNVSLGSATISNLDRLVDADIGNFASITPVASFDGKVTLSVRKELLPFTSGHYAGFDIATVNLLGANVLTGITISTHNNDGPALQSVTGGNLVSVSSTALSGTGRRQIGFLTTADFDEIRLTVDYALVANLGVLNVYGAVVQKFCASNPALACNTLTQVKNTTHPVFVDGEKTGITSAVCAGCSINNSEFAVDDNTANAAEIVLTVSVSDEAAASFAVTNALETFGPTSFAGFKIETGSLIAASVLGTAKVELYMNDLLVQPWTGNNLLLGVSSALLDGPNTQIIGVVANAGVTYNSVKITFVQPVNANVGTIKIFGAIFDKNCAGTITCNTLYKLNMPENPAVDVNMPVVIDAQRTGSTGIACVLCSVKDAYNAVSPSLTDFAQMSTLVASAETSLAVVNPIDTYPAGATAGFTVRKRGELVSLGLLDYLKITTYNNGVEQESKSTGGLLDLSITLFGGTSDFFNVGFITKKPFDEVQISLGSLVSANLIDKSIDVYGAFVDTRTAAGGALLCFNTNPDNNVTEKGVQVSGNLSTNDNVAALTEYKNPTADPNQPNPNTTDLPVIATNGTYTFVSSTPGIYSFNVEVCVPGQASCFTEALTITVLDKDLNTNPPVANDDVAVVKGDPTTPLPVIVDVAANDGPGNPGGTLGNPTIPAIPGQPANGTAVAENGKIKYTPNPGFYGEDVVTYQICESPSHANACTKAELVVTVLRPEAPNTLSASDDYMSTSKNKELVVAAADGVLANDTDPDGDLLTVTLADLDIAGGHLVLNANGSYTFTPTANYTGPSSYVYTVCDALSNCRQATLYLLVQAVPNLDPTIPIDNLNFASSGENMERDFLVKLTENLGSPTDETTISFRVSRLSAFDITVPGITLSGTDQSGVSGNSSVNGTTANTNGNWMFKQDDNFIIVTSKPGVTFAGNGFVNIGFHVKRKASIAVNTTQNITVTIIAGSGGETDFTDNTSIIRIKAN